MVSKNRNQSGNAGAHLRGTKVRSQYLGYACYAYGPMDGQRKIHAKLRHNLMPPRIDPTVAEMMPREFFWPTSSHEEAHRCIDSLYLMRVDEVRTWAKQFPDHQFGWGDFVERAERWAAANRAESRSGRTPDPDPGERVAPAPSAAAAEVAPPLGLAPGHIFPVWVKRVCPIRELSVGDVCLHLSVIYFSNGEPALRMDVYPAGIGLNDDPAEIRQDRLSRVHADLVGKEYEIIEHFPGRYAHLGLNPKILMALVGGDVDVAKRRSIWDDDRVQKARQRARAVANAPTQLSMARQTVRAAHELYGSETAREDVTEEVFAPHKLPAGLAR
jgi:hypothetical protein